MTNLEKSSIIINQVCHNIEPGKKMLQKLLYLVGRNGVNLDLNYSIHFFGPYSSKLDNLLHVLESYNQLTIDTSGNTHIIRLGENTIEGNLDCDDQEKLNFVLGNFMKESAYNLEALTTTDYVAFYMLKNQSNDEEIINTVKKFKGTKFNDEQLAHCLKVLRDCNYLS